MSPILPSTAEITQGNDLESPDSPHLPLDWFDYQIEHCDDGTTTDQYALQSEMNPRQCHFVSLEKGSTEVRILPVDAPQGSLSLMEAITYVEELQRCIIAASFVAGAAGA